MPSTRDQRPYNVAYHHSHRDEEIERVRSRQQATTEWLREVRRRPCADCGESFPPYVMDFDHRDPSTKSFSLMGGKVLLKPRDELIAEIEKCDIVCANCHRMRTYAAFMDGTLRSPYFTRDQKPPASEKAAKHRAKWHRLRDQGIEVIDRFRERPCADCGRSYSLCVMEFDHRDGSPKRSTVPYLAGRVRLETLLAEVAKCDVVCANCHRVRTYKRRTAANAKQLQWISEGRAEFAA